MFSHYTKARIIGSGVWFMLHLKSFNLKTIEDINSLFSDIHLIKDKFGCVVCRKHLQEYIDTNDPNEYLNSDIIDLKNGKRPENLAKFLVDVHNNATNQRERKNTKPILYSEVKNFFDNIDTLPCDNCDSSSKEELKEEVKKEEKPTLKMKIISWNDDY